MLHIPKLFGVSYGMRECKRVLLTTLQRKWVEEDIKDREPDRAGETIQWDPIALTKTDRVVLSYSRIRAISNLAGLSSLTTLKLDNNEIGKCASRL